MFVRHMRVQLLSSLGEPWLWCHSVPGVRGHRHLSVGGGVHVGWGKMKVSLPFPCFGCEPTGRLLSSFAGLELRPSHCLMSCQYRCYTPVAPLLCPSAISKWFWGHCLPPPELLLLSVVSVRHVNFGSWPTQASVMNMGTCRMVTNGEEHMGTYRMTRTT